MPIVYKNLDMYVSAIVLPQSWQVLKRVHPWKLSMLEEYSCGMLKLAEKIIVGHGCPHKNKSRIVQGNGMEYSYSMYRKYPRGGSVTQQNGTSCLGLKCFARGTCPIRVISLYMYLGTWVCLKGGQTIGNFMLVLETIQGSLFMLTIQLPYLPTKLLYPSSHVVPGKSYCQVDSLVKEGEGKWLYNRILWYFPTVLWTL